MNNDILELLEISPKKIRSKGKTKILDEKYVVKKTNKSNQKIYDYLSSRGFYNFPQFILEKDGLEVTEYKKELDMDQNQKIEDMIYLLTILHNKTTFYKELDLDEIKRLYEETIDQLNYLISYYQSIQSIIEEEVYMSPANYYFIINSDKFYRVFNKGLYFIEKWLEQVQNKKSIRFVLNHNHLSKDHLVESDGLYFVSWDRASFGFPISDLEMLWKNNYEYLDLETLLSGYNSKYKLCEEEYFYYLARLCIIKRIDFNQDEHKKIKEIIELVKYIEKLDYYFLKQNSNKTNYQPH